MIIYVFSLLLLTFGCLAVALQRLYSAVPARELKRLATQGDSLARAVYRPVAFGTSLRLLLWLVAGFSFAGGFTLFAQTAPAIATFALLVVTLGALLVWLPTLALTSVSARLAMWCAPGLAWILQRIGRPLGVIARVLNRPRTREVHSRLYEKADLHDLLEQQQKQSDNRIEPDALERAKRALKFSDRYAADIVCPRKKFRAVETHESLGPILLDELHAAKQNTFLVFDGTFDNMVGVLTLADALKAKQGGQVSSAMRPSITYVHEAFTLPEVLAALTATGQQLAVVVNASEEVVGVITLQQLVSELAGELPEQTTTYDDRASVAASRETFPTSAQETQEEQIESSDELVAPQQSSEQDDSFAETSEVIE